MKIPFPVARALTRWGSVGFAGLAVGCLSVVVGTTQPPKSFALAAIVAVIAAAACTAWAMRLAALARFPFQTLGAGHTVTFGKGRLRDDGAIIAEARVHSDSEFESLVDGQKSVRLQKFVVEPTTLDPQDLLTDWHYACSIGEQIFAPEPVLSPSRSLRLDVPLAEPSKAGARFSIAEDLTFESFLDGPARLVFQPSYPSGAQSVVISFDGPKPLSARYRIERGLGNSESGDLALSESGAESGISFVWERAEPGEQLVIEWDWDPATLPEPMSEAERLIAAARKRQEDFQKILATQFGAEEGGDGESAEAHAIIKAARAREALYVQGAAPALSGDLGFEDEQQGADDHPIIKAARAREKLYKSDD